MQKLKLKVFSIEDLEIILKGVSRLVSGICLNVRKDSTLISISYDGKIRAFITTEALKLSKDCSIDSTDLCFENVSTLLQGIVFIKKIGKVQDTCILETDNKFLYFGGENELGALKLKLDKRERVEQFISPALKTELKNIFYFELTQQKINDIIEYSRFNPSYELKAYFYQKNNTLMVDIDNQKEMTGVLSVVSIPITDNIKGTCLTPFIMDLNDLTKLNILKQDNIKLALTDRCIKVCSSVESTVNNNTIKTNLLAVVRLLKD